ESEHYQWGFSLLGPIGATIVYAALCLMSVIFLTAFPFGDWIRNRVSGAEPVTKGATSEEAVLERKAKDLQKQAKKLQDEVDRNGGKVPERAAERSGLGADLQPVPEPTVRDLSVPQAKPRTKKSATPEPVKEPTPAEEGMVIPARELAAASTADVLGKTSEAKPDDKPVDKDEKAAESAEKPADKPGEP